MGAVAPGPTTDGAVVLPVTLQLKITTEPNEFQQDFRE
jgi:hypothetical protein